MRKLLLILFLSQYSCVTAEVIKGPAIVMPEVQDVAMVSLNDGVQVSCTKLIDGWYQISISLKINKEKYDRGESILKGEKLIGWNDKVIGVATRDIPSNQTSHWTNGGAPGIPKRFGMEVYGFISAGSIYEWSIPENPLNKLLENKNLSETTFRDYFKKFEFINGGLLRSLAPTLTEYMIYENEIDDPSPLDRLRLIFEGQKLVAIVHSRELQTLDWKTEQIARGRQLTIMAIPKGMNLDQFIAINNKAYAGID